jgi:hypothetical protein
MLRYTTTTFTIYKAIHPLLLIILLNNCSCKPNPNPNHKPNPSTYSEPSHQPDQSSKKSLLTHATDPTNKFHRAIRKIDTDYQANKADGSLKTIHQTLTNLPPTATPNEVFNTIMQKPYNAADDELPVIHWLVKKKLLDYKQQNVDNKTPFETLLASWESTPNTDRASSEHLQALGGIIGLIVNQLQPTEQADNLAKCIETILNKLEKGKGFRMEDEVLLDGAFRSNSITVAPEKATNLANRIKSAAIDTGARDYLLLFLPAEYRNIT